MSDFEFKVDEIREQFPALSKTVNGIQAAFLDGPGGTQVPVRVVEKINDYLYYRNANSRHHRSGAGSGQGSPWLMKASPIMS